MALKRKPPSWLLRLKSGSQAGWSVFLGTAGFAGIVIGGVSATGTVISVGLIVLTGLMCAVMGLGAAFFRGRIKLLPDSFLDDMGSDGLYTCKTCSRPNFKEACDMTKPYYGTGYIPYDTAEQWRVKNPKGFVEIVNADGILCACFGAIALENSFMDQFIAGRVTEKQLAADSILSFDESKRATRVYISGVVVRDPSTYKGSKRARVMVWALFQYLRKIYGVRRTRTVFALAVTQEAERLLNKLNFKLHTAAQNRSDRCNLYSLPLNKHTLNNLLVLIGDFSPMCKIEF